MPLDEEGNRADIIMDGDSTIKRMNIGRLYEQYINATSRHVTNQVVQWMQNPTEAAIQSAWNYVLGYYQIVSPRMYDIMISDRYNASPRHHLETIVKSGIYLYLPTDSPAYYPDVIERLRREYPIHFGPVTYRGRSGRVVTTKHPVLIGSLYIMLLEKTGDDWSGVSSSKLQHFGLPAKLTKHDKYALPGRAQPVRILGETEGRLLSATVGSDMTAEILEMSNNPQTHKHVVGNIMRADQPSNISNVIDRSIVPRGGSRSLLYINHSLQCAGIELYSKPYVETPPTIYPPTE